jgi:hypothetical protein
MENGMKFLIVIVILIVLIKMQTKLEPFDSETIDAEKIIERRQYENVYRLDPTGEIAEYDVSNMPISVDCCPAQYMCETDLQNNNCEYSKKYVANNYSGMNYEDGLGCICMTPKQANFIGTRGGNSSSGCN